MVFIFFTIFFGADDMAIKTNGIVKIKNSMTYDLLSFLKELTTTLTSQKVNHSEVDLLFSKNPSNKNMAVTRLISYCYNSPHIIWYIDKYMNNKYDFNKLSESDFFHSIRFLLHQHDIMKTRRLFFLKSEENKERNDQEFKKLIRNYYKLIEGRHINNLELNHFFSLYKKNVITYQDIFKMHKLLHNNTNCPIQEQSINSDIDLDLMRSNVLTHLQSSTTENVQKVITKLNQIKESNPVCASCKFINNQLIPFDSNNDNIKQLDFLIVGVHPSERDIKYKKPFTDDGGIFIREQLESYKYSTNIGFINLMSCMCADDDLGKSKKQQTECIDGCKHIFTSLIKLTNPKYIITVGSKATAYLGITDPISKVCGQLITTDDHTIIPMVNPVSLLKYENTKISNSFNFCLKQMKAIITRTEISSETASFVHNIKVDKPKTKQTTTKKSKSKSNSTPHADQPTSKQSYQQRNADMSDQDKIDKLISQFNIDPDDIITEVGDDLTFFDSTSINPKFILNIFLTKDGVQKFQILPFSMPVFINQVPWDASLMINSEFTNHLILTDSNDKYKLNIALRNNMESNKRCVNVS